MLTMMVLPSLGKIHRILIVMSLLVLVTAVVSLEAEWTPNEDDKTGPLPLSTQQRQQLLQLEQAIRQSPDPSATLQQVAAQNNMDPTDLADMLERNHADMILQGMTIPQPQPRSRNLWKAATSLVAVGMQAATRHPRAATITLSALLCILYIAISAPQTGLVLSSGSRRSILTKVHTTVFAPPVNYIHQQLNQRISRMPDTTLGVQQLDAWKDVERLVVKTGCDDGVTWHSKSAIHKKNLKQAVTAQATIDLTDEFFDGQRDDDDEKNLPDDILEWSLEHATSIVSARDFTEWVPQQPQSLRMISDDNKEHAILVVKKMGDWGRYGLLPLQVTHEDDNVGVVSVTFTTIQGAHWDGQLHISVSHHDNSSSSSNRSELVVRVHLIVPKKGRAPSRSIATAITEGLAQSIATSIRTRTRQSLARYAQSSRYGVAAQRRALERRHSRSEKERQMEEMAADRRLRWQRQHPNVGAYRPSGDRMRSPNNAVY